ncbi:TerB family tellurite resistance protein [Ectothiorhodospiraceae bacterium 2226]|nr:TerB family tellurite resistance protein [Ectothiorhodospiraceae bacterium 2226]
MLDAITRFFKQHISVQDDAPSQDGEHRLHLATAALLIEMTRMDEETRNDQCDVAAQAVQTKFGLSDAETRELLRLAEAEVKDATDYYQFTSLINRHFSYPQRVKVMDYLWDVAYADGKVALYEEHLARKLAELLYVDHVDFIAAKHRSAARAGVES